MNIMHITDWLFVIANDLGSKVPEINYCPLFSEIDDAQTFSDGAENCSFIINQMTFINYKIILLLWYIKPSHKLFLKIKKSRQSIKLPLCETQNLKNEQIHISRISFAFAD